MPYATAQVRPAKAGSAEAASRIAEYADRMAASAPLKLKVGMVGSMQDLSAKVLQVIDENRMLVGVESAKAGDGRYRTVVMVKCKTAGITDGKFYGIDWEGMTGSSSLKVTGTTTYKTRSGSKTVFVIEPEDKAGSAAKAKIARDIPQIAGVWSETGDIQVTILQTGTNFVATCTYNHPEHGEVRWKMIGTVSKGRTIAGKLTHTKAPKGWVGQTRTGSLSADGKTIKGRAVFEGGGHEFVWSKSVDAASFVGKWRIGEGKGADACYFILKAPNEARRSDNPSATGTWKVVGNEVRITWHDDWKDAIRVQRDGFLKLAFKPGVGWEETPTNTQAATMEDLSAPSSKKNR